jgi:tRNA threonylcarbamoyladenosine biosynthesis protein TsaB
MIVLGFDTATPSTAVGLRLADGRTLQARDDPRAGEHPGHATRLLAMAADLLSAERLSWREVDRIAVGLGPGTFTGLRVGVATARGLAQSLQAELVGVSSLRALAAQALAGAAPQGDAPTDDGRPDDVDASLAGAVLAVIDARRGEAFAAAYSPGAGGVPEELAPAAALAPDDLGEMLAAASDRGGPGRRWLAVGDGAVRFRAHLETLDVAVPSDLSPLHRVSAEWVCELGALGRPVAAVEQLLPDYRRRPDAELALEAVSPGGR